jgi:hypothetical protein
MRPSLSADERAEIGVATQPSGHVVKLGRISGLTGRWVVRDVAKPVVDLVSIHHRIPRHGAKYGLVIRRQSGYAENPAPLRSQQAVIERLEKAADVQSDNTAGPEIGDGIESVASELNI